MSVIHSFTCSLIRLCATPFQSFRTVSFFMFRTFFAVRVCSWSMFYDEIEIFYHLKNQSEYELQWKEIRWSGFESANSRARTFSVCEWFCCAYSNRLKCLSLREHLMQLQISNVKKTIREEKECPRQVNHMFRLWICLIHSTFPHIRSSELWLHSPSARSQINLRKEAVNCVCDWVPLRTKHTLSASAVGVKCDIFKLFRECIGWYFSVRHTKAHESANQWINVKWFISFACLST